eukprot:Gregarina_sp_Poly_1__8424@NODE_495_length_7936_cov_45_131783_g398_i0_p2_GENE_NODE_495_length_7936_cov_45_131783_g398_i0NODE_495_length_7936_cov_45_131783_g398_i0_p2_ORF_typecomplete_len819_score121_91_NODE_495_length_7936_cov_45_131783_g398_i054307886
MTRSLTLKIENLTSLIWYRTFHNSFNFVWAKAPPEVLVPGFIQECQVSRKSANEIGFKINYSFICRSVPYSLLVAFSSSHSNHLDCQCGIKEVATNVASATPLPEAVKAAQLLILSKDIDEAQRCCTLVLQETEFGKQFFDSSREELFAKFDRIRSQWAAKLRLPIPTLASPRPSFNQGGSSSLSACDSTSDWEVVDEELIDEFDMEWFDSPGLFVGSLVEGSPGDTSATLETLYDELADCLKSCPLFYLRRLLIEAARQEVPSSFLWRVGNFKWEKRLREKKYSIYIRVVNHSRQVIVCDLHKTLGSLIECQFQELPNEMISPGGFSDFGVATEKFVAFQFGVNLAYKFLGHEHSDSKPKGLLSINIEANITTIAKIRFSYAYVPEPDSIDKLDVLVVGYMESMNEGNIQLYVLDQKRPPFVQIINARALRKAPKLPTPFLGSEDYTKKVDIWHHYGLDNGLDLTNNLINKILQEKVAKKNSVFESTNHFLLIPKRLFWWCGVFESREQKSPILPLIKKYNLNSVRNLLSELVERSSLKYSCLFLEWKIDSVIHIGYFDQTESILIDSTMVHGIAGHDSFISVTVDERPLLSPLILDRINNFIQDITQGKIEECPQLQAAMERWENHNRLDSLLSAAHQTLFLFAEGFGPFLAELLSAQKSKHLDSSIVPSGHIWDFENRVAVDADGVLFIVNTHWHEGIDGIFPEGLSLFQPIQVLATYWATQDTEVIGTELVLAAMQSATTILHRVGQMGPAYRLSSIYKELTKYSARPLTPTTPSKGAVESLMACDSFPVSARKTEESPVWMKGIGWSLGPLVE